MPVGDLPVARRAGRAAIDRLRDAHTAASAEHAALLGLVADLVDEVAAATGVPVGGDPVDSARFGRLGGDPAEAVVTEIALALRVGVAGARRLVQDALALTTVLPRSHAALRAGTIGPGQAHAVVTETAGLTPEQTRWVDDQIADDLPRLDPRGVTRRVRALVARLEVDATRRRVRYETCRRKILVQPLGDGAAELVAIGPVADITALFTRIDTWARTRTGPNASADPHAAVAAGLDPTVTDPAGLPDHRGVDARRFDALVGLATLTSAEAGAPRREDGRAHTGPCTGPALNIALTTLVGLDDEPAFLAGHGPVPADVARELLADGHPYRRVLTDPFTGRVLGVDGHLHHLPTTATRTTTARTVTGTATGTTTGTTTSTARSATAPDVSDPAGAAPTTAPAETAPSTSPPDARLDPAPQPAPNPVSHPTTVGTTPIPPGPADELTRTADADADADTATSPRAASPGFGTPGSAAPPWAAAPEAGETGGRTPRPSACPLAGLPIDYVPTAEQSRYVRAVLPECTFPGCTVPATRCDLDHQTPHGAGGPTCECNLRPRCRKHHQCRTHFGWLVEAITDDPDDPHGLGTRWTSPLGLVHDDPAPTFLPRPIHADAHDGSSALPAGWHDHDPHPEPTYPTVDMAWPGARLLISAATTTHHPEPPQPSTSPDDEDPPPF